MKWKTVSDDFYNFIQVIKDSLISSDENNYIKEVTVKSNRDSIITDDWLSNYG